MDFHDWGERCPCTPCPVTAEQQKSMDTVLTWTVFHQPFFAHLLMAELPITFTKDVPIAATDAFRIFINPEPFFAYTIQEQAFILCHEVMHCVYSDPQMMHKWRKSGNVAVNARSLPYYHQLMNIAMDLVINPLLITGRVGAYRSEWLFDPLYSREGLEASVEVYEKLWDNAKKVDLQPGEYMPGNGKPGQGFDILLEPGSGTDKTPDETMAQRDEQTWKEAIASAAQAADMQGKLPSTLKRLVGEILNPKVSWQEHIRAELNRISGSEGLDWTQANRRLICRDMLGYDPIFFARSSGYSTGTIVVGVDTSGSIGDEQVTAFFREMHGIFEDMNPENLVIMDCDATVHSVRYVADMSELDDVRKEGVAGGGGTSFVPVFDKIEELGIEPDVLVYLTDMEGTFPKQAPQYPVIWGTIKEHKAPFGEVIHVEV